jgi:tetratricopeptide (TPR) repeat protein
LPIIDRDRWRVLEPLLDRALDLTPEERNAWLDEMSTEQPAVAAELRGLLTEDASAERDGFLARPLEITLEGLQVGAYTLERPLGHGGMGTVWLARRTDGRFEGYAAVKLLNLSLLTERGQERFRREGSLLARLTHPGIARLYDAGVSPAGQPYLILEYVDGVPLDDFAEQGALSIDERLSLFLRVLDAVRHAHANLIVHRDLKPSNILVTAKGEPKLLDFGIAKLVDDETGIASVSITLEAVTAFTPQFASPEQARGGPVTTATDVYALGVIVYLLISGNHPTATGCTTPEDTVRALLRVEPRPLGLADLDAIVAKALQKDSAERYQTVDAFGEDIARYLRNEPVLARRSSMAYRARKFIRRHRLAVSVGAAMAAVLLAATVFSIAQLREARRQRDVAVSAGRRADAQAEFATLLMSQIGESPITVREILERSRDAIEHQYSGDPRFLSEALVQLSARYGELGETKVRGALLERAQSIADGKDVQRLAEIRCGMADNLRTEGRHTEARALLARVDTMLRVSPDPTVEAQCLLVRADLENELSEPEKSAPAIKRALAIRDSMGMTRDNLYVSLLVDLGYTFERQGHSREAVAVDRRAIALMDSTGRGGTMSAAIAEHDLAVIVAGIGETREAEHLLADVLRRIARVDPQGRMPTQPLIHYAHAALYQEHTDSARKYFALLADQAAADHNPYWEGRALFGLTQAELQLGRVADARRALERFRPMSSNPKLRASDDQVVNVNTLDALFALAAHDTAKAHALVGSTLRTYGYFTGKRSSVLHSTLMLAARTSLALHRPDSALAFARDARIKATTDSLAETQSARVGEARLLESRAELALGKASAARADALLAVEALRFGAGAEHPRTKEAVAYLESLGAGPSR